MLRVAMIGFGGIAHIAHIKPYLQLRAQGRATLVAACDIRPEVFDQKVEINIGGENIALDETTKRYTDWKQMLENEEIDLVDICVPTYLHAEIAIAALESGHHVLCEKPMSLGYEQCKKMYEAAHKAGKKLMIGQCVRFSNAMNYVKKLIDEKTYGEVKSATMHRLSSAPRWAWDNWYMDYNRSRGCIMDLHVHDIDFARYAFGEPEAVSCFTTDITSGKDIAHSRLIYKDFTVLAMGDWSRDGFQFDKKFTVNFEKATVEVVGNDVMIGLRGGDKGAEATKAEGLTPNNAYADEIFYFVDVIEGKIENTKNPPESSAMTIKLVNTLAESADKNGEVISFSAK